MTSSSHLVIPGQLIAVSHEGNEETSFLRGHGTYIEHGQDSKSNETYLRASVTGTVQRVNKLISVLPWTVNRYEGHVGDLVVGRITGVGMNRWKVQLIAHGPAAGLPLSGVHLPGGIQRVRTQQDAREMRLFLKEGDLVSAEVHKVMQDGTTLQLHTRSTRYGKLDNGCLVTVPPGRIPKRKNHYVSNFLQKFDILLACNGWIWMQRAVKAFSGNSSNNEQQQQQQLGGPELAELQEAQRAQHAAEPYSTEDRLALARLRNSVECLRLTSCCQITVENIAQVYQQSLHMELKPAEMLPQVLTLTSSVMSKD